MQIDRTGQYKKRNRTGFYFMKSIYENKVIIRIQENSTRKKHR
jgi:hypothetical protein